MPTAISGRLDCPKCGHFWGLTGGWGDLEGFISDNEKADLSVQRIIRTRRKIVRKFKNLGMGRAGKEIW